MGKQVANVDPRILFRRATIEKEMKLLESDINDLLPMHCRLATTFQSEAFTTLYAGDGLDFSTQREVGGRTPIVPMSTSDWEREQFWLNLAIFWSQNSRGAANTFAYRTAGITIFYGAASDARKVQLVRAEWPGLKYRPDDKSFVFEAPGAGHPHWQIDEPRSREAMATAREDEKRRLVAELEGTPVTTVIDTLLEGAVADIGAGPRNSVEWTKIHFAQRAMWHEQACIDVVQFSNLHAHTPSDFVQVKNWLLSTVSYLKNEIARF